MQNEITPLRQAELIESEEARLRLPIEDRPIERKNYKRSPGVFRIYVPAVRYKIATQNLNLELPYEFGIN